MNAPRLPMPQSHSSAAFFITTAATVLAVLLLVTSAWLANASMGKAEAGDILIAQVRDARFAAETVLSTLKDAETGQRGYLLTGDVAYLKPYNAARGRLDRDFVNLDAAPLMNPERARRIETIRSLAAAKLVELGRTITLFQSGQAAAALSLVRTNTGKEVMDAIRAEIDTLQLDAVARLAQTDTEREAKRSWAVVLVLAGLASVLLGAVAWTQRRARLHIAASLYQLERFTRAFGLTPGMMRGLDGRITYWSPGAERMYGYRSDQAIGQISHLLLCTNFSRPLPEVESVLSRDGYWQGELVHTRADGALVNVVSTWALHSGEAPEAGAIIEVNTDITGMKRAEADLRESEMKLRLALNASGQGVWQWELGNGSGKMIWDARCKTMFGIAPDAAPDYQRWIGAFAERDRVIAETALMQALDPNNPDDDFAQEHSVQHPGCNTVWIAAAGRALFEPDPSAPAGRRPVRIMGTARDISESKRAEEGRRRADALLHTIVETAPGLIYAKDLGGRMLLANAPVMALIGKPWDQVTGRTDKEFLEDPVQAEAVMRNDRRIMEQGQAEKFEEAVSGPNGQLRIFASTKAPMAGPDGQVVGLVGVSVEITEQKHAQEQLLLMLNELNHRVKNTLATVVAISSQTLRGLDPLIRQSLEARLLSLASAHDVLTRENWERAALSDVVAEALVPFDGWNAARFWISGPPVSLRPSAVLAVAMGLHELATNAVRYGALSSLAGRIEIRWETVDDDPPLLRLLWIERDGPKVIPPTRRGFGTRLIERSLSQDLRGTAKINFDDPDGVTCVIEAPLAEVIPSPDGLSFPRVGGL